MGKVSADAAAIAAASLVQAHAAYIAPRAKTVAPDQLVEQMAWAYRKYLAVIEGGGVSHADDAPVD